MKVFTIVAVIVPFVLFPLSTFAQGLVLDHGVELGPGGVWLDPGYHHGQGSYGYHGHGTYGGHRAHGGQEFRGRCRELRQACLRKEELGEEGMGNCRRYRQTCGRY